MPTPTAGSSTDWLGAGFKFMFAEALVADQVTRCSAGSGANGVGGVWGWIHTQSNQAWLNQGRAAKTRLRGTLRTFGGKGGEGCGASPSNGCCAEYAAAPGGCCRCCPGGGACFCWSVSGKGSPLCSAKSGELLPAATLVAGCAGFLRSKGKCCQPYCVLPLGLAVHAELGSGPSKAGAHMPPCSRLSSEPACSS